jgi:hypothetical protein
MEDDLVVFIEHIGKIDWHIIFSLNAVALALLDDDPPISLAAARRSTAKDTPKRYLTIQAFGKPGAGDEVGADAASPPQWDHRSSFACADQGRDVVVFTGCEDGAFAVRAWRG